MQPRQQSYYLGHRPWRLAPRITIDTPTNGPGPTRLAGYLVEPREHYRAYEYNTLSDDNLPPYAKPDMPQSEVYATWLAKAEAGPWKNGLFSQLSRQYNTQLEALSFPGGADELLTPKISRVTSMTSHAKGGEDFTGPAA
ncbi:hypothetical protein TOPH_05626 [Tolypocladium ophioglossoides CBS 100239]|uniref:Uncharacterized protein n=1 Tax=Tolypocladium ophioglossoides (strain CBS 100239) TaxID=1163406 RepID=A0A0L0N660_TOLOC|nr:hypothetical protein TOPH_05626 [Tolypocladium ophioglossoides CBS 100239]